MLWPKALTFKSEFQQRVSIAFEFSLLLQHLWRHHQNRNVNKRFLLLHLNDGVRRARIIHDDASGSGNLLLGDVSIWPKFVVLGPAFDEKELTLLFWDSRFSRFICPRSNASNGSAFASLNSKLVPPGCRMHWSRRFDQSAHVHFETIFLVSLLFCSTTLRVPDRDATV